MGVQILEKRSDGKWGNVKNPEMERTLGKPNYMGYFEALIPSNTKSRSTQISGNWNDSLTPGSLDRSNPDQSLTQVTQAEISAELKNAINKALLAHAQQKDPDFLLKRIGKIPGVHTASTGQEIRCSPGGR